MNTNENGDCVQVVTCCDCCMDSSHEAPVATAIGGILMVSTCATALAYTCSFTNKAEATCRDGPWCKSCVYQVDNNKYTDRYCFWGPASETYVYYRTDDPQSSAVFIQLLMYGIFTCWFMVISICIVTKGLYQLWKQSKGKLNFNNV